MRRVPFLLEIQDLWPDTLGATGMMNNRALLNMVGRWCKWTYRHASRIVVLSPGFKELLVSRGVPEGKIEVVYNWCDEEKRILEASPDASLAEELGFHGRFNILYSGTMGKAQALAPVLSAAELLKERIPEIRFVFMGAGIETERLKKIAVAKKLENVVFHPRRPVEKIGEVLKIADVLLVHLKDDPLFRITIPSKIQAYLAAGRPILAAVGGNAATMVAEAGAGIPCTPESPGDIAEAAEKLYSMPASEREAMGGNGRKYYYRELSLDRGVERYDAIFRGLAH
jgi:glycosyltransferase involved in cell wall biosynthesis